MILKLIMIEKKFNKGCSVILASVIILAVIMFIIEWIYGDPLDSAGSIGMLIISLFFVFIGVMWFIVKNSE